MTFTKEKYKTPEIQANRDESWALTELLVGLRWALSSNIEKSIKTVKDKGGKVPKNIYSLRKAIKAECKKIEVRLKKLDEEYSRMVDRCEHDFTDESEPYPWREYDIYRCKKCGFTKYIK